MVSSEPLLSSNASIAVVVCPFHLCPHDTAGSQHGDEFEASYFCGRDDTDESFIKDCSFGQLADHIPALAAAGWGHEDLFGVSDNPILQGIQCLVTAHPHVSAGMPADQSLRSQNVSCVDKCTFDFFEPMAFPRAAATEVFRAAPTFLRSPSDSNQACMESG